MKRIPNKLSKVTLIDQLLPQTHCKKCGYDSCNPYARAIVEKSEEINKCPPGGKKVIQEISKIIGKKTNRNELKNFEESPPQLVSIIEEECIGCGLCLPKCPVDAIAGAKKFLHSIISDECSGCNLCIEPCPVDCIIEIPRPKHLKWDASKSNLSRKKYKEKKEKLFYKKKHSSNISGLSTLKKNLSKLNFE